MGKKKEQVEGTELIRLERMRQVAVEGYSAAHDDEHLCGEISLAAACYAAPEAIFLVDERHGEFLFHEAWPWDEEFDKRVRDRSGKIKRRDMGDKRIRQLVKAGALIAAEIDRLQRLG